MMSWIANPLLPTSKRYHHSPSPSPSHAYTHEKSTSFPLLFLLVDLSRPSMVTWFCMPLEAEMHGVFLFPFPSVWGKFIPPYLCYYVLENTLNFSWFLCGMIGRSLTWDMEVDGNVWWDQILVVFSLILKGLSSTLHWRHSIS